MKTIIRLCNIAIKSEKFNTYGLINLLENNFDYVKMEGNNKGVVFYNTGALNSRQTEPTYFLSFDLKKVLVFKIETTYYQYYAGTYCVDSSIDIYESEEGYFANCDWNDSTFYFDDTTYPYWIS